MIATERENSSSLGLTPLITGIIEDAQVLIRQQLSLFQSEIKTDLDRTKNAAMPLIAGTAVSLLAGFFVFMAAAHFMVWMWPALPLFGAYGIVGLALVLLGGTLVIVGKNKLDTIRQVAEKSVEGLKENIQWAKK
jgi:hypothetical protein